VSTTQSVDGRYSNFEEVLNEALRSIGGDVVALGLKDPHKKDVMKRAVRWFIAKRGQKKIHQTQFVQSLSEYVMPEDCEHVVDVIFPKPKLDLAFSGVFDSAIEPSLIYTSSAPAEYSFLIQIFQQREVGKRVLGVDPSWQYSTVDRKLRVMPIDGADIQSGMMWISYLSSTLDLTRMTTRESEILMRRMASEAKFTVGMIRRKYGEWPGPGGTVALDGSDMVSEAKDEFDMLDDELVQLSFPISFIVG